ncbi:MAG: GGDEF domain-containing protein [Eubacteriales bacterium]
MSLIFNIILNTYSIIILSIIYIYFLRLNEKVSVQNKLFMLILQTTAVILLFDIFGRFDGSRYPVFYILNHTGNFIIFLLSPVLPSLWLLYIYNYILGWSKKVKTLLYILYAVNAANFIMLLFSQYFKWYYYIDSNNIYHRGSLYLLSASVVIILLIAATFMVILNRRRIDRKHFFPLIFFAVPPFICIFLQIKFYGISMMINSVVFSMLIMFLNTQTRSIYIDHLTGVYNRKKLESYLKKKVHKCMPNKTFSAVMIDMDNFKNINDTLGHNIGDEALKNYANLLKSCLKQDDFISRYGGDEFCIVLNLSDMASLEKIVGKIKHCAEKYNETNDRPYKLGMSMGYAVYDYHSHMNAEEFQHLIDRLMYDDKQNKITE